MEGLIVVGVLALFALFLAAKTIKIIRVRIFIFLKAWRHRL